MGRQGSGLSVIFILMVVIGGFGYLLWSNAQPAQPARPLVPTQIVPTEATNTWQEVLRAGFGDKSTPLPTSTPAQPFTAPTLIPDNAASPTPLEAADLSNNDATAPIAVAVTPTRPLPTPAEQSTITAQDVTRPPTNWQPPPLIPPLSRDPLGRDHYWFQRPVESNANSEALFYYTYGSDGPEKNNPLRVHHGIDMPNPVGEAVRAAGSGIINFAGEGIFDDSPSYGTVVEIQHDFGYRGQPLFTIYAHLSLALVTKGQYVKAGDVIGLVGSTGRVSGPHIHFEVRLGKSSYGTSYNPLLWMVPFVNTGVIAGRVMDTEGNLLNDQDISVRSRVTGLQQDTTTSYVYQDTGSEVNADPIWQENFVIGDVPVGRYEVISIINGQRISKIVEVVEGTTTFVELQPTEPATALPGTPPRHYRASHA